MRPQSPRGPMHGPPRGGPLPRPGGPRHQHPPGQGLGPRGPQHQHQQQHHQQGRGPGPRGPRPPAPGNFQQPQFNHGQQGKKVGTFTYILLTVYVYLLGEHVQVN